MSNLFTDEEQALDALNEAFAAAPDVGEYDNAPLDDDLDGYQYDSGEQDDYAEQDQPQDQQDADTAEPDINSRVSDLDQRLHRWELEEARQRNQALAQQLEDARQQLNQQQEQSNPRFDPMALVDGTDLTDEELQTYGQSQAVIEKLAKRAAAQLLAQYDNQRIAQIEGNLGKLRELEQGQQQIQQMQASTKLEATVAQVRAANPWLAQEINRAEYHDFLNQRQPGSLYTRGETINAAAREGRVEIINEILAGYGRNPANNQQTRPVGASVSPGRANAAAAPRPANAGQGQTYDYNKYRNAFSKLQRGEMSMEEFEKEQDRYFTAMAAGRVVM